LGIYEYCSDSEFYVDKNSEFHSEIARNIPVSIMLHNRTSGCRLSYNMNILMLDIILNIHILRSIF
jgi:hypothetical protein